MFPSFTFCLQCVYTRYHRALIIITLYTLREHTASRSYRGRLVGWLRLGLSRRMQVSVDWLVVLRT